MKLYYLPNAITVFRIALVPVFILVLDEENYMAALVVFAVAGISDGLDGFIAKRFNLVTRIGAILDPLADKILLVTAYIMLVLLGHLPLWLVLAVGFRDLLIVSGYLVYTSLVGPLQMRPSLLSKFNTLLQIALVVVVLGQQAGLLPFIGSADYLVYAVFGTTVASTVHYAWIWRVKLQPDTLQESNGPDT
ncbi:MAG: CDP-alcohol phosphatidyltransferase family protein [Acidiferrobacterales bacterium]